MSITEEIEETETILGSVKSSGLKVVLQSHLSKLKNKQAAEVAAAAAAADVPRAAAASTSAPSPLIGAVSPPIAPLSSSSSTVYIPIESYAWDQGEYNSPTLSIFVDLDGVGVGEGAKDRVTVSFHRTGFDLKVLNLNGHNYRLVQNNLEKDIVPDQCSFSVKKNKVVLKLQKVKGEYSYEHWTALLSKKKRDPNEENVDKKKDPMGG